MDGLQIAHDLAVAKLYGSNLSEEEMYKAYLQYRDSFLKYISSEPVQTAKTKVFPRPF